MKEKLTKNLGIKLLSLVLAAILWIVIVNLDDPMKSREFKGVVVEMLNEDSIKSLDKVYEIIEGASVDITVRGKKSIIDKLKSSDIKASADLANRYIVDPDSKILNVHIDAICTKYTPSTVDVRITGSAQVLKISLEDIDTKQFKVTVVQNGTVEEGYAIGSIVAKPNMVEVSGAQSQIARIAEVRVYMDVNGLSEDTNVKLAPKVFDIDGKEIDSTKMKFSAPEITVTVKLQYTKTIPVFIEVKGKPIYGYQYVQKDYEPKQIEIASDLKTLSKIPSITIPVDITGASTDVELDIDVSEYLPKGVSVSDDSKIVTIKVTVEKLVTREFTFNTNEIQIRNLADGLDVGFAQNTNQVIVKIMGLNKDISKLTKESLNAYIDLTDLIEGNYTVPVQFILNESMEITYNPSVIIYISANNNQDGDETEDDIPDSSPTPVATTEPAYIPEEDE